MIFDDRLLTALPFYNDRGKQAFRQEKCFRNLHTWKQLTDLQHLPPFEIITDCTGTSCSGSSWELYDTTDTLVQDLEAAAYDICSLIDDYSGNDKDDNYKTWFIYSGGAFCADLPSGLHYIKATIGACTYYSEIFNICVPKSATYTDSAEVYSSWTNISFDFFGSTGRNITEATDGDGSGDTAETDEFCGSTGSVFDYSFAFTWNTINDVMEMYLVDSGDTLASNILTVSAQTTYTGQFTTTRDGPYKLVLESTDITDVVEILGSSLTRRIYDVDYSNNIQLEYGHTCDINNIVYQYGFKNKVIFAEKVDLVKPTYETVKTGESREGFFFVNNVVDKKTYKMTFYAPEYVGDFMSTLAMHDTITLTDKNGDSVSIDEVNVTITPTSNCFFRVDCEFITDPINSSNCCNNLTLT